MKDEWVQFLNQLSHDPYLFEVEDFMPSAWIGHSPIMKFLIREMQPKTFVELGVHNGFSYFVACQSIAQNRADTRAFAIDHWVGDEQAGFFSREVFQSVTQINSKYDSFSTLLKMNFEDALTKFEPKSIDLLHIDGLHTYESVRADFYSWLPKISENGVLLLHDIHVRRTSFGVYKLWEEIKKNFLTIEFVGSHGLGVVFLGKSTGKLDLVRQMSEAGFLPQIQGTFGSISDDILQSWRNNEINRFQTKLTELVAERDGLVAERDVVLENLKSISESTIWKSTRPYRLMRDKLAKLNN